MGGFGSLAFSIPLGLSAGRPFSPFSRAISARWAATVCSSAATLPSNLTTSAFSSVGRVRRGHPGEPSSQGIRGDGSGKRKPRAATRFAAGTRIVTDKCIEENCYFTNGAFANYERSRITSVIAKLR